jgi:hypothetical protein
LFPVWAIMNKTALNSVDMYFNFFGMNTYE